MPFKADSRHIKTKKLLWLTLLVLIITFVFHSSIRAREIELNGSIVLDGYVTQIGHAPGSSIAYVISKKKRMIFIVDLANSLVRERIKVRGRPVGVAVEPESDYAFVSIRKGRKGYLFLVSPDGSIVEKILLKDRPGKIAINPQTNTLIVALEKEKKLLLISKETLSVTGEISLPYRPELLGLDRDSDRAVVVSKSSDNKHGHRQGEDHRGRKSMIMIVDLESGTLLDEISFRERIHDIAIDTDRDIAVILWNRGITLMDINTGDVIKTFSKQNKGCKKCFKKHGSCHFRHKGVVDINQSTHMAVVAAAGELYFIDLNEKKILAYHFGKRGHAEVISVDPYQNRALIGARIDKRKLRYPFKPDNPKKLSDHSSFNERNKPKKHEKRNNPRERTRLFIVQLPNPVPEITALIPDASRAGEGVSLRVEGRLFITDSGVRFNHQDVNTTFINNETLHADVPAELLSEPGSVPVTVFN
ncbi:MAG TPA: hypothetical protein ENK09_01830, partial [Nitrospirae bacterium]|nr:hypothetical protein [Nitrospirota bacterium]